MSDYPKLRASRRIVGDEVIAVVESPEISLLVVPGFFAKGILERLNSWRSGLLAAYLAQIQFSVRVCVNRSCWRLRH